MNFERLKEYFDTYLRNYLPYGDEQIYSVIIDHLLKYYYKNMYEKDGDLTIPKQLKELYEDFYFASDELLDVFLVAIGLPQNLIDKLSNSYKRLFLKVFAGFQKYKSTIRFFVDIAKTFDSYNLNIYELHIDYDESAVPKPGSPYYKEDPNVPYISSPEFSGDTLNDLETYGDYTGTDYLVYRIKIDSTDNALYDTFKWSSTDGSIWNQTNVPITGGEQDLNNGVKIKFNNLKGHTVNDEWRFIAKLGKPTITSPWCLKAVPIYIGNNKLQHANLPIPYIVAYEKIPSLLVDESHLDTLKSGNVRDDTDDHGNLLLPVKTNILLLEYDYTRKISLLYDVIHIILLKTIKDDSITLYFEDTAYTSIFKIVYFAWYYLLTRFYKTKFSLISYDALLHFSTDLTNKDVTYIDDIINEYNNITTRNDFDVFYQKLMDDFYTTNYSSVQEYDYLQLGQILKTLDEDLFLYLDNRINSVDERIDIIKIVDEIFNSFIIFFENHTNTLVTQYQDYFLKYLSQINVDLDSLPSLAFLDTLSPYHVELLPNMLDGITVDDRAGERVYIEDNLDSNLMFKLIRASVLSVSDVESFKILLEQFINFTIVDFIDKIEQGYFDRCEIDDKLAQFILVIFKATVQVIQAERYYYKLFLTQEDVQQAISLLEKISHSVQDDTLKNIIQDELEHISNILVMSLETITTVVDFILTSDDIVDTFGIIVRKYLDYYVTYEDSTLHNSMSSELSARWEFEQTSSTTILDEVIFLEPENV